MPRARTTGLVARALDGEMVVYDLERDEAHHLNHTVAAVWLWCDGQTTVDTMAAALRCSLGSDVADDAVWHALADLSRIALLEKETPRPPRGTMSRRDMMLKAGAGMTVALPLVTSVTIPQATMAASGVCIQPNGNCSPNAANKPCCPPFTCKAPANGGQDYKCR
jgi:hypothetical protein